MNRDADSLAAYRRAALAAVLANDWGRVGELLAERAFLVGTRQAAHEMAPVIRNAIGAV